MKLSIDYIVENKKEFEAKNIATAEYDIKKVHEATVKAPIWVHFGAGNIFRGYIAALQDDLLNKGMADKGIVAAETFDYDIIDKIYKPFDNLTMMATLLPDGNISKKVISSIAEGIKADLSDAAEAARLKEIFTDKGLQFISFTVTEKGYALKGPDGNFFPVVMQDIENGPAVPKHAMSIVASLLYTRFLNGAYPLAVVSMDNCSHNGEKLKAAVLTIAQAWEEKGFVGKDFVEYLNDESKIAFPWSMIDKITPRPAQVVEEKLEADGLEQMSPVITSRNTYIAPFVNAEGPQYLVIEDKFPNGRPALEKAGVYFTDRDTVNKVERMKVTTCLNPLHTALAVYGCLLGYTLIADEMKDKELTGLIRKIGYVEGMKVVTDPGIISPKAFIDEVIEKRLPNPFMPDTPQRIATDTSQKVAIRFGETIKSYVKDSTLDVNDLTCIPLALAGWLRYLLAVDDNMNPFELSKDPMLDTLLPALASVKAGDPASYNGQLKPILSNANIFGIDLYEAGVAEKVEKMFVEMLAGKSAVRNTLVKYVD